MKKQANVKNARPLMIGEIIMYPKAIVVSKVIPGKVVPHAVVRLPNLMPHTL